MECETDVKRGHKNMPFFDYSQIDKDNVKLLKQKARKLSKIDTMSLFDAGKELKEVQDIFANKNVSFQKWIGSLGISPKTAYNYINVYYFLVKHVSHIKDLEKLPARILYKISKPSAEPGIIEAVIRGEIKSSKDMKAYEFNIIDAEGTENSESVSHNKEVKSAQIEHQFNSADEETHEKKLESIFTDVVELKKSLSGNTALGIEELKKLLSMLESLNSEITNFQELLLRRIRENEEEKGTKKSGIQLLFDVYTKKHNS